MKMDARTNRILATKKMRPELAEGAAKRKQGGRRKWRPGTLALKEIRFATPFRDGKDHGLRSLNKSSLIFLLPLLDHMFK